MASLILAMSAFGLGMFALGMAVSVLMLLHNSGAPRKSSASKIIISTHMADGSPIPDYTIPVVIEADAKQ